MVARAWPLMVAAAVLCVTPVYCHTCAPGVDTPGVTIPEGDILLEYGEILEIVCVINTTHKLTRGRDARYLQFYKNGKLIGKEKVELINSTTAKLHDRPEPSKSVYTCKLGQNEADEVLVCANIVTVGYKPRPVMDFSCISENWMNINCSWKEQENPIQTKYELFYQLPGPTGERNLFACPDNTEKYHYCLWNLTTQPMYRRHFKVYYFRMFGTNAFGTVDFDKYTFRHFAHVIPAKPEMLTYRNVTVNSVLLEWRLPFPMTEFPVGLSYKIQYKALCDSSNEWETADTCGLTKNASSFNLRNLKFANSEYHVKLFIRSRESTDEKKWSQPASVTFRTKADVPMYPPKVSEGSFQVFKKQYGRDITLYWQQIPRCAESGDDFHYKVLSVEENGVRKEVKPEYTGRSYAKFKNLSFDSYKFEIVSINVVGQSYNKATLLIPSEMNRPPEPTELTKYVSQSGAVQLSWNPVSNDAWSDRIQNYTIFWCQNEYEVPHQCMGVLHWIYSDEGTRQQILPVSHVPLDEFAIAANADSGSSGMIWTTCLLHSRDELIRATDVYISAATSSTLEVGFFLKCVNHLDNVFYSIYYCPLTTARMSVCEGPENKTVKTETHKVTSVITGLLPYTTYIVYIIPVIISAGTIIKQGEASEVIHHTTLESAPSKPREVVICCVTNESFTVQWKPPLQINGVLRHYKVNYNNETITVGPKEGLKAKLQELESYMTYIVSVSACTVRCSNFTDPITVTTEIGVPGAVKDVAVTWKSSSVIDVKWEPPEHKGGKVDYYEVKFISLNSYSSSTLHSVIRSRDNQQIIHVKECKKGSRTFRLAVRAVNKNDSNNVFYGSWSEVKDVVCTSAEQAQGFHPTLWAIMAMVVALFCCTVLHLLKRLVSWWSLAKNIEVKLPPGLTHYNDKDNDYHKGTMWLLKGENLSESQELLPAADQEVLLPMGLDHSMKDATIKIMNYDPDQLSDTQLPRVQRNEVTVSEDKVIQSVASKSSEELPLRRDNSVLNMMHISGSKSATKSLPNLSEFVETASMVHECKLESCIVEKTISVKDIAFDNDCLSKVEDLQKPKDMSGYVSTNCKQDSLLSLSNLSAVSSVSYELPGHGTIFKDFSCTLSDQDENNTCKPDSLLSLSSLSSVSSVSYELPGHGTIFKNSFCTLSSQDSVSSKYSQQKPEMLKNVTTEREEEKKKNQKESVIISDEQQNGTLMQTRTKSGSLVCLCTANIHSPESYCHIGLSSETPHLHCNQAENGFQHIQLFSQKCIECETHCINFQLAIDYGDIFNNEGLCLSLSSCSSLEQLNDIDSEEPPTVTSNNYISTKAAAVVINTD